MHHEGVCGIADIAPMILNLGIEWMWGVSFTLLLLCSQQNTPRYPFKRSLGWSQSRSGRFGVEKNYSSAGNRVNFWEPYLKISQNASPSYVNCCSPDLTASFEIEKLLFKVSYNTNIEPQHIEHADGFQFSEKSDTNYSPGVFLTLPSRSDLSP
jgi:hypothetical protein